MDEWVGWVPEPIHPISLPKLLMDSYIRRANHMLPVKVQVDRWMGGWVGVGMIQVGWVGRWVGGWVGGCGHGLGRMGG